MNEPDRSTARGTVKLVLAQLVMAGCGVATHIYLTRALQPKLYGPALCNRSCMACWPSSLR